MAQNPMFIRQDNQDYVLPEDLERFCRSCGVQTEYWDVASLDKAVCRKAATDPEAQQEILKAFKPELTALKQRNGYLTEDIVCLSPETPNLTDLLAQFEKTHHHTDDEVRVILAGRGVFGIEPPGEPSFEIHVEAGDVLVVPAYTRHWFTLYPEKHVVAVRVFKTSAGWKAIYGVEEPPQYEVLSAVPPV